MSSSEWNRDQAHGEFVMRATEAERGADEGQAQVARELRELLAAFLDAHVLPGQPLTREQWEQACLLCGRLCPPFTDAAARERGWRLMGGE